MCASYRLKCIFFYYLASICIFNWFAHNCLTENLYKELYVYTIPTCINLRYLLFASIVQEDYDSKLYESHIKTMLKISWLVHGVYVSMKSNPKISQYNILLLLYQGGFQFMTLTFRGLRCGLRSFPSLLLLLFFCWEVFI